VQLLHQVVLRVTPCVYTYIYTYIYRVHPTLGITLRHNGGAVCSAVLACLGGTSLDAKEKAVQLLEQVD